MIAFVLAVALLVPGSVVVYPRDSDGGVVKPGATTCGISPTASGLRPGELVSWEIRFRDGRAVSSFASRADSLGRWHGQRLAGVGFGPLAFHWSDEHGNSGAVDFVGTCASNWKPPLTLPATDVASPVAPPAVTGGLASWYADPGASQGALYAAVPGYRGRPFYAVVHRFWRDRYGEHHRSVRVLVADSCGCYVGTSRERVIDLSWRAFTRLGLSLSRGIMQVQVERP